jgi:hypothetical protein
MSWQVASAESIGNLPAMTGESCSVHGSATSWYSGMPYKIPGRPGRLVVPGSSIGADSIVARANASYCPYRMSPGGEPGRTTFAAGDSRPEKEEWDE